MPRTTATSQRVTRSSSTGLATAPTFSVGVGGGESTTSVRQRSNRRAALRAQARITEELAPQRRSTRLATAASASSTSNNNNTNNDLESSSAILSSPSSSTTVRRPTNSNNNSARRSAASQRTRNKAPESPIDLCNSDSDDDDVPLNELKPAAKSSMVAVAAASSASANNNNETTVPKDFTCAICLDAPSSLTELATISGCTHRFCFDCIDKWAKVSLFKLFCGEI